MEKKTGRPRSEETRKSVISAAYELLLENGFKAVTVDGIALRSGVSKATIYKWWPNKAAVVLDAFFEITEIMLQVPDTGSVKEDLFIQVNSLASFLTSDKGRVITEFIGEGQFDKNIAQEYRKRYFVPRRLISKEIIDRGIIRGELRKDIDIDLVIDLIFAPLFYRLLITDKPLESAYIREVVTYGLMGFE
ncbi:MAG: TetR/AcrR family transcriptional regulator [Acetobacterium woodii]|nr:TetR/AcrR family transcriptional regulator [Acetobacterium woodii]